MATRTAMAAHRGALALTCLAIAACASYRFLPPPPPADGFSPLPVRYESSRLFFFRSQGDDTAVERVFADPFDSATLLATVTQPAAGVLASHDGAASWDFSKLLLDERSELRVLREVLFDPAQAGRIFARTFAGLLRSEDGGRSWTALPVGEKGRAVSALALGKDGSLYAAQRDAIYASADHGQTFRKLPLQLAPAARDEDRPRGVRIRSVLADPALAKTVYVSVEVEPPPTGFARRMLGLLDQTSDEGVAARMLVERADLPPQGVSFGDPRAAVYATRDGGGLWQRTALGLDAWLVARDGAIYAVGADPLLEAAGLARRSPDLASMVTAQLHASHVDSTALRAACAYPGRERLLGAAPAAPVFRSVDGGATWSREGAPDTALAIALSASIEAQRAGRDPWPRRQETAAPARRGGPESGGPGGGAPGGGGSGGRGGGWGGRGGGRGGRGGQRASQPGGVQRGPQADVTDAVLSLLDPQRLLAAAGPGLQLTGVAGSDRRLWAYAPTAAFWEKLADAVVSATELQGELSLSRASGLRPDGAAFELLRSEDAGASWSRLEAPLATDAALAARGIVPYPESMAASPAQLLLVLSGGDRRGVPWRQLFRASGF